MDKPFFDNFFRQAPASLDLPAIREEWLSLGDEYDVESWQLPLPLWAQRPYNDSGERAWQALTQDLAGTDSSRPMCIYIHIPFCSSKCGFCDSYSFKLENHRDAHIEKYLERICAELRLWSHTENLSQRPVSTVHLGGGTPAYLGESAMRRLVECYRENFAISPNTEWALETTVESLTPIMIATLHDLGFRRLHIGVQTMENRVRATIGRRRSSEEVLQATQATLALGWIVSVDLLCGLPGQTLEGYLEGIQSLMAVGVNGFSLYELLIRSQNHRWAEFHGLTRRSHLPNYFMMQAGANLLESNGYHKNLFNHWADKKDTNVYFTFPRREEDCLAIGAIADGVFGDYHYRHPRYQSYLETDESHSPGLEGGLRRNAQETKLQPLTAAILSASIQQDLFADFNRIIISGIPLIERWLAHSLVRWDANGGLDLTTNGTWFAGNMVTELKS